MEGIKIPIGAPLNQLDSDLKGAQSKLKSFASNAAQTAGVLGGSVAKGANSAGFALQNLGRVAQDAPFGFIGIQNNLIPLLESFQRLKVESGSTGGALKALTASLVGGGGLLLGVSLVTSALTVLAQNPEKVTGALNYLSGVVESATGTQKAYNEALTEATADAKVEIVTLENLVSIAQDETLSRNARLEAVKKLKAEYPEQLNFLTLENVESKKTAAAIDLLSNSLLRKAKIQAAEKILGEAFVKQLQATTKSVTEQASTMAKVVGGIANAVGIKNIIVLAEGFKEQQKAIKEAGQEIDVYTKLLKSLNTEEAKSGTLFNDPVKSAPKKENFRDKQFDRRGMMDVSGRVQIGLDGLLEQYRLTEWEIGRVELVPPPAPIQSKLSTILQYMQKFNADASSIINGSLVQTFAGIGEAIGNSLATGTSFVKSLGNSLLSALGSVLGQLGQMAIATGVAILGIKTALKTLNPFAAIGAGVALLALSGVVKGAAAKLGGGIGGGGVSVATPGASNQVATSAVNTTSDFGSGRVVFEISGNNLIGVLNRAGAELRRFGP